MAQLDKIRVSGTTYDILDSSALHNLDSTVTSGGTNAVQGSGIYNAITASTAAALQTVSEAGYQTSGDVQTLTADLFGAVEYDSNTKRINFYHQSTTGTVLAYVDATDFIKDGFLESVEIKDVEISGETVTCLVFTWNTAAGVEETDIPIADIFDADNYWTTAQTQSAITQAVSGKQDTLIAGQGISIDSANTISCTATVTVDSALSDVSENPVQNKVVKAAIDAKNPMAYLDGTTLVLS